MKALGQELGMAESTVSLYESGKRCPDIQTMIRFADYFNVSLDYLCGRDFSPRIEKDDWANRVLSLFDELNIEGQEKLIDYADDLVQSGKYIKMHSHRMAQES